MMVVKICLAQLVKRNQQFITFILFFPSFDTGIEKHRKANHTPGTLYRSTFSGFLANGAEEKKEKVRELRGW